MKRTKKAKRQKKDANLERVVVSVALKSHLVSDPAARALVFRVKPHEEHRVERVDDRVADPARFAEVGALATDRVVLVCAHRVPLCHPILNPEKKRNTKELLRTIC